MAKTEHEQVHLRAGRHSVSVDPHIALLIGNLWQRGIETVSSCQEDRPGWVWIEFATARDAERFLNLVARFEPEPNLLFRRILRSSVSGGRELSHFAGQGNGWPAVVGGGRLAGKWRPGAGAIRLKRREAEG